MARIRPNGTPNNFDIIYSPWEKSLAAALTSLLTIGIIALINLKIEVAVMRTELAYIKSQLHNSYIPPSTPTLTNNANLTPSHP